MLKGELLPEEIDEQALKATIFDIVDGKSLLIREIVPRLKKRMPHATEEMVKYIVWGLVNDEYLDFSVIGKVMRRR